MFQVSVDWKHVQNPFVPRYFWRYLEALDDAEMADSNTRDIQSLCTHSLSPPLRVRCMLVQ